MKRRERERERGGLESTQNGKLKKKRGREKKGAEMRGGEAWKGDNDRKEAKPTLA